MLASSVAFGRTQAPGLDDHLKFASREIPAPNSPRPFSEATQTGIRLPRSIELGGEDVPFNEALEKSGTAAWIVVRNGQIVDERYFGGRTEDTLFPIYSVTKSVVGTLVAIAASKGELPGLGTDVAPMLASAFASAPRCSGLSWQHLLDMRSGIAFSEEYGDERSDVARLYFADDLDAEASSYDCNPGSAFRYASIDTQWLGVALERQTGKSLDAQLSERLWGPMGARYAATWSTDAEGRIKGFCCLNARARDVARFGQLVADGGRRDASQIIPDRWIKGLLERARNGDSYADHWWLLHDPSAEQGGVALLARGILGQFVFIHPSANLVIVRIGAEEGTMPWLPLFGAIVAANTDKS